MYRVQVSHGDPDHPNAAPAHIGPAFDEGFVAMAAHFRPGEEVDLLREAQDFRDLQIAEHEAQGHAVDDELGYSIEVVQLVDNPETNTTTWEVVE